eukprot:SAG31_NODE_1468_length_8223_cov_37.850320_12_plen_119_part_00
MRVAQIMKQVWLYLLFRRRVAHVLNLELGRCHHRHIVVETKRSTTASVLFDCPVDTATCSLVHVRLPVKKNTKGTASTMLKEVAAIHHACEAINEDGHLQWPRNHHFHRGLPNLLDVQ